MSATHTVRGRIERARTTRSPREIGIGLALIAALGFALLFLQEPAAHDAMHNFRHAAGITCH